jgi:hypothetical protein
MATKRLAFLVEGQGDEEAIPVLIRRIALTMDPGLVVSIPHQARTSKGYLLKEEEFLRMLRRSRRYLASGDGILVVMDADADCPKHISELLLGWATTHHADLNVAIVVAKREMEAWFVAGAESLKQGLGNNPNAEAMPDPKAWVSRNILGRYYAPTADQAALASRLDLGMARCVQSFDKFFRDVSRLLS